MLEKHPVSGDLCPEGMFSQIRFIPKVIRYTYFPKKKSWKASLVSHETKLSFLRRDPTLV
jgi:hypothetical protein